MEKQDSIVVNLTELYKTIRQMRKDDMYLVELQIMPLGTISVTSPKWSEISFR